ncbi:hypothetical protein [Streptomyces sp. NBC_00425]|uniref:hypothetical protein n=1 Tax=Streptomyces sp. NBC_00425 TaxID=2975740 RepID=UPI002E248987
MSAPAAGVLNTATSEPREAWCPACKAYTAAEVDVHALFPTGLMLLGTLSACEICDDPTDQGGSDV